MTSMRKDRPPASPGKPYSTRSKTSRQNGLRPLSSLTEALIRPAMRGRSAVLTRLISQWPEIAGDMADWTRPVDVLHSKSGKSDSTLILSIPSGRGPEAQMRSGELCNKLNSIMGFKLIGRIQFRQDLSLNSTRKT